MSPSIVPDIEADTRPAAPSLWQRVSRTAVLRALLRLEHGEIRLLDGEQDLSFGRRTDRCALSATIRVLHPQFFAEVALGGSVGAGEAYIHGYWSCDDLTALMRILVVNRTALSAIEGGLARTTRPLLKLFHRRRRNTRSGSARNIAAHYDLGNDLYRLMLDETMAYSCGIFESGQATLADASRAKFDAVCRKLALSGADRVLEIGAGWGGFALHAARHYGCHVTTTTISRVQYDYVRDRIATEGLEGRIRVLLEDYRDLGGRFDKLVSIEMIEAVGADYLDAYFARCAALLEPDGMMLLQAITLQDQFYPQALRSVDYIQRFVFPGSFIPSITALAAAIARSGDLKIFHLEDIGPHYARTLALWRANFMRHLAEVRRLGYSDSFVRLWEFYLCYCEGGFAERQLGDIQALLTKPGCRRAPIASVHAA